MNIPDFHPSIDELAPRVLHGQADDAECAELSRLLSHDPENRRRFLDHTALHSLLAQEAKAGAFAENPDEYFRRIEALPANQSKRILKFWLPAVAAAAAACLAIVAVLPMTASAALDRVINAMEKTVDRTYQITVLETAGAEAGTSHAGRGRFPPANHLDGAKLWLRGPGEFVLSQSLPNGQTRIIGGDGSGSWSMRGDGPVRFSTDPQRFGRAIFDNSGEIAFLNLRTQLEEIRSLYQIEWLDRASRQTWKLRGLRRTHEQGGPREIELWFQPDSGLLEKMILRHLPRGNGGPRSIAITLRTTEPLPPDFFNHTRHHEPGRGILAEP